MKKLLGKIVKFKKVKLPSKKKLIGKYCQLEPLNIKKKLMAGKLNQMKKKYIF